MLNLGKSFSLLPYIFEKILINSNCVHWALKLNCDIHDPWSWGSRPRVGQFGHIMKMHSNLRKSLSTPTHIAYLWCLWILPSRLWNSCNPRPLPCLYIIKDGVTVKWNYSVYKILDIFLLYSTHTFQKRNWMVMMSMKCST